MNFDWYFKKKKQKPSGSCVLFLAAANGRTHTHSGLTQKTPMSAHFHYEQAFSVKAERNEALPVCCNNVSIISVQMLSEVRS